jgi:hypothetical protein
MAKGATKRARAQKGKIAAAAMVAGAGGATGTQLVRLDPRAIEQAMAKASEDALAAGITDSDKIRKLMLAAREAVKAEYREAEAKALEAAQAEATKKGR